jgi:hypothetical protein
MADEFVALFAGETFTPELVWGEVNRKELCEVIKTLFAGINVTSPKIARGEGGSWPVSPPPLQSISGKIGKVAYSNIRDLTRVGGIYLEVLFFTSLLLHQFLILIPIGGVHLDVLSVTSVSSLTLPLSPLSIHAGDTNTEVLSLSTRTRPKFQNPETLIPIQVLNQRPDWPLGDPSLLLGKVLDMLEHGVDGSPPSTQQCFAGLEVARSICRADPGDLSLNPKH